MDQERMLYKVHDVGKLTGEFLLKTLAFMVESGRDKYVSWSADKHYIGETEWDKFMATSSEKDVKTFLSNEVNLGKVKSYLEEYRIGFTTRDEPNGKVSLAFEVKNHAFVETAFEQLTRDLTNPEKIKEVNQRLLKTPKNISFEDKLAYYQAKTAKEIAQKVDKTPSIKLEKGEEMMKF